MQDLADDIIAFMNAKGYDATVYPINNKAMPIVVVRHRCKSLSEYNDTIAHFNQLSCMGVLDYQTEEPDEV
jgi:hypothetical protein